MARYALAAITGILIVVLGALTACGTGSINGPVTVAEGQKTGDVTTVNGAVKVEDGATVGAAMTVNGSVVLGANVTAGSVKTVNGEVSVGSASRVSGNVMTVNGAVILDEHADVIGKIANVNGAIRLTSAHVGGGIGTVSGDIDVGDGSRVDGGIRVEKPDFSTEPQHVPRIVIGPNTVVNGPLRFEREVQLYISDSAQVGGPIEGATPQKYAGEQPAG
jgi:cytoskeletal protein CcmA (bactofilin family)